MKIGVGFTTYNRREHLNTALAFLESNSHNVKLYVAYDSDKDRKGIAARKTECLRELQDCDYIFLFDDDCFPIKQGWEQLFIDSYKYTGQHHFIYQHETSGVGIKEIKDGVISYDNCNGCMMFITQEALKKVGAFNPNFGLYGLEHANYSNRIHLAGLSPIGQYVCPIGAEKYIYSMDIDHYLPEVQKKVKHKPSIKPIEAVKLARQNMSVYQNDKTIYYPL